MIALVSIIALTFWPPPESVLSDTPWEQQRVILIEQEPTEENIDLDLEIRHYRKTLRLMELQK
jgi:hypothetical protein